jgi:BNR/Asp-box repeat
VTVEAPPGPPRPTESIDPAELEALVEALIEEARRRARRRRRRHAACLLLVGVAGAAIFIGFDRAGSGATHAPPSAGAPSGAVAGRTGAPRWAASHGPDGGPVHALAVAPSAPTVVYVGTGRGVLKSTNRGRSWANAGLAGRQIVSLAVDPRAATTAYAARGEWVDLGYREEVFKTTDGGRTWRPLAVKGHLVAIGSGGTVYAVAGTNGGKGHHVSRSDDGGRTWHAAEQGLPAKTSRGSSPTHGCGTPRTRSPAGSSRPPTAAGAGEPRPAWS